MSLDANCKRGPCRLPNDNLQKNETQRVLSSKMLQFPQVVSTRPIKPPISHKLIQPRTPRPLEISCHLEKGNINERHQFLLKHVQFIVFQWLKKFMMVMLPRCINKFAHPLFSKDLEAHCKLVNSENQNSKQAETLKMKRFCHRIQQPLLLFFCFKSYWLTCHSNGLLINFSMIILKNI